MAEIGKILLVEDDTDLRESLHEYLHLSGFHVCSVGSGMEFYPQLNSGQFAVAIIDIGLPDQSGYVLAEYCRTNTNLRIIIITANDTPDARLESYKAGGDLFFSKPLDTEELAAAIKNLVTRKAQSNTSPSTVEDTSQWRLDKSKWILISPDGDSIKLTAKELIIVETMGASAGTPIERKTLLQKLYPRVDSYTSRSLDTLMRRLRSKCFEQTQKTLPIQTVHGTGFCFSAGLKLT